jgi:hypothetical protein
LKQDCKNNTANHDKRNTRHNGDETKEISYSSTFIQISECRGR